MQGWWRLATVRDLMRSDQWQDCRRTVRVARHYQTHNFIARSHKQHEGNTARLATLKR